MQVVLRCAHHLLGPLEGDHGRQPLLQFPPTALDGKAAASAGALDRVATVQPALLGSAVGQVVVSHLTSATSRALREQCASVTQIVR